MYKKQLHTVTAMFMALYLAVLSLTVEPQEFVHVPRLLQHFAEHKTEKASLGFFEFLTLHYGASASEHSNSKDPAHSSLPLRSNDVHADVMMPVFIGQPITAVFIPEHRAVEAHPYYASQPSGYISVVFQPPKA